MLFNSLPFWIFFILFFIVYFLTRGKVRLGVCLAGSYLFYGWWDWRFLGLILLLTTLNYYFGFLIAQTSSTSRRRKFYLFLSMASSLGILGFFKYFNFGITNLMGILESLGFQANWGTLRIILPVGISFYTFQTMSYCIDLYRGELPLERSFLKFATFVAFFPQLVAGPIVRAIDFLPQLDRDHAFDWDRCLSGMGIVVWGLVLKIVMADSLGLVVDSRFADPSAHNSLSLLLSVVFYAFQIYGDFCGYSLIAIGVARILGFDFKKNFDMPYFSKNFSEFWQRWHISLSSWLRDYLYIPLGGNKSGPVRTGINLMITMLLGGLWHGANWTFVIWGGLHGGYLILQRVVGHAYGHVIQAVKLPDILSRLFLILLCFSLTSFAWVFFRAQSLTDAWEIIHRIVSMDNLSFSGVTHKFHVIKGLGVISMVLSLEIMGRWLKLNLKKQGTLFLSTHIIFCLICISLFGTFGETAFIYFQF